MSERAKLLADVITATFPHGFPDSIPPMVKKFIEFNFNTIHLPKDEFFELYSEVPLSHYTLIAQGAYGEERVQHFTEGVQTKEQFNKYFINWLKKSLPTRLFVMLSLWCQDVMRNNPRKYREILEKQKWVLEKVYLDAKMGVIKCFEWELYPDYIKLIDIFLNAPDLFGEVPAKNIFQHKGLKINEKKFSFSHLKMLYTLLKESQLIDQSTALEDFLGIFTGKMLHDMPSIRWGSEKPLQVVYLVKRLNEIELLTPKDRINWTALNHCFLKPDGKKFNFKRQYGYKFSDRAIERDGSPLSQSDVQKIDNIVKQIEKAVDTHP